MIYYNGELVNWTNEKDTSKLTQDVRSQILELNNKFFGKNAAGYAIVRYPKGTRKKNASGYYEPVKAYIVDHRSADGMWVYSKSKKKTNKDGYDEFVDKWTVIRDPYVVQAKDVEFLWFLMYQSSSLKAKRVYIEDLEAEATKEAKELASDVDIRFLIYGKHSPLSKDEEAFRKIATVFGIPNVSKVGFNQLKNTVFNVLSEGEKSNNRFINYAIFEKLANGKQRLRTSYIVRSAINDGTLKFNPRDYKWYFANGGELIEPLFTLKLIDVPMKEELLVEAALSDVALKGAIFSALGVSDFESVEELREFPKHTLMGMASRYGLEVKNTDVVEELVKKICGKFDLEYKPKPS